MDYAKYIKVICLFIQIILNKVGILRGIERKFFVLMNLFYFQPLKT